MGSFSIWHWLVVLLIVLVLFGTKKIRNIGEDLGSAIKSFRKGLQDGENAPTEQLKADPTIVGEPPRAEAKREPGRTE